MTQMVKNLPASAGDAGGPGLIPGGGGVQISRRRAWQLTHGVTKSQT